MYSIIFLLFILYMVFQFIYICIPWLYAYPEEIRKISKEKGFSIIIPAYNESKIIIDTLLANRKLHYNNYEIIVVNDGSSDNTLSLLKDELSLKRRFRYLKRNLNYNDVKGIYRSNIYPNLWVVDKLNGGKADALNVGIDLANHDWVITVDADTVLKEDALTIMNHTTEDKSVVAIGGSVHVSQGYSNNKPSFLPKGLINYQVIQYLTSFYLQKFTQSKFQAITVISGAFGVFSKPLLLDIDGYRKSVGEDMDIAIKIHKWIKQQNYRYHMIYKPEAVAFTQCPTGYKDIFKQRFRWQKAFIDCMAVYYKDLFRGLNFSTSCYFLIDAFILGTLNTFFILLIPFGLLLGHNFLGIFLFLIVSSLFIGAFQNLTAILISRRFQHKYKVKDNILVTFFLLFEVFTYRLLGLLFVSIGTILYFSDKDSWYKVKR